MYVQKYADTFKHVYICIYIYILCIETYWYINTNTQFMIMQALWIVNSVKSAPAPGEHQLKHIFKYHTMAGEYTSTCTSGYVGQKGCSLERWAWSELCQSIIFGMCLSYPAKKEMLNSSFRRHHQRRCFFENPFDQKLLIWGHYLGKFDDRWSRFPDSWPTLC